MKTDIEIPFGAKDSELKGWEYTIPEGMEAVVKDGKVIVREKESEDGRIREELIGGLMWQRDNLNANGRHDDNLILPGFTMRVGDLLAYLEKQKELFESGRGLYYYDGEKTTYCGYPATEENPYDFAMSQQEEQKEQKPDIELIKRSWYMEGYTDGEFKREPMWNLKAGKGGPKYEKNEKYGQPLELKPTEWGEEDELMRTAVIQTLKMFGGRGTTEMQIDWLKSLRPQSHWKPSEEQMAALAAAKIGIDTDYELLESLYEQLKAL